MPGNIGVITVQKETSGVDDTNQDIDISVASSFTPTFCRIFTESTNISGASNLVGVAYAEGWTDGNNHWSIGAQYEEDSGDMDTSRYCSKTKLLKIYTDAGVLDSECEFVSFSSDRITVKWTKSSTTAIKLHVCLMDPINVEVVFQTAKTSGGSQDINHGSFTGNAVWAMGTTQTNLDTLEAVGILFFGMATGADEEQNISYFDDHGTIIGDSKRGVTPSAVLKGYDESGVQNYIANFLSFSLGKITINWADPAVSAWEIGYVIFEFDDAKVGNSTNPGTTPDDTISGLGFDANGVITTTIQSSSLNTGDGVFQAGMADGESTPNNACAGHYTGDEVSVGSSGTIEEDAQCVRMYFHNGSDRATGRVTGYGTGTVTFAWADESGTRQFQWMAFDITTGSGGAAAVPGPANTIYNASLMI